MHLGIDKIFTPIDSKPTGGRTLHIEVRRVGIDLHLRRRSNVNNLPTEFHFEETMVVATENVGQVVELRKHLLYFDHIVQMETQVHEPVVAEARRMVHEQQHFAVRLRDLAFQPVQLVAGHFATGTVDKEYLPAANLDAVIALAVLDFEVVEIPHDFDTVMVARNDAYRYRIILDLFLDKMVAARLGIFVSQVAR